MTPNTNPRNGHLLRSSRFLCTLIALCFPVMCEAGPAAATLDARDQADLKRIESYLDGIRTLKAEFDQTNPDGSVSSGDVYMLRPGKMRFEYAPPTQLLIVSDGNYVGVNDLEMKQVTFYPVASTPAWFLLRESIRMSGDVTVTGFERGPDSLRVTAVQTRSPDNGAITLVFSDHPLQLEKWEVLDTTRHTTSIALAEAHEGVKLDPKLFELPQRPKPTSPGSH
jgi:outer membrane lipoprotein-sorting protein